MSVHYYVEYTVGRSGRRVVRTRSGFAAFLAVLIDTALAVVLGIVGFALWLVWFAIRATFRVAAELLYWLGRSFQALAKVLLDLGRVPVRALTTPEKPRTEPAVVAKPVYIGFGEV